MTEEKKKKKIWTFGRVVIVFLVFAFIGMLGWKSGTEQTTTQKTDTKIEEVKTVTEERTLDEHYHKHQKYIWYICQEWLKLISTWNNINWPTFAWEIDWRFYVEWEENGKTFVCEFVPFNNKRWMNLVDVRFK